VSSTVYEFYVNHAAFAGNGFVTVDIDHGSRWESSMATASLSGTYLTLPEQLEFKTATTHTGGIYLGGRVAANHLDDYEEGTWTPTVAGGTAGYQIRTGRYTKIGNLVRLRCAVKLNSWSGTGTVTTMIGVLHIFPINQMPILGFVGLILLQYFLDNKIQLMQILEWYIQI
jgi:hypothetical protein